MKCLFIILTVLQSLFTTLEQKTLQSDFTISVTEEQAQPMTYTGSMSMHGKQFALEMLGMEAAYDGHTLYIYSEDIEELTISNPTEEELTQTNPFLFAQTLLPVCQYTEKVIGDKTQITLTPYGSAAGISKFILRVTTANLLPVSAEIHEIEGNITTLRLSNARYIDNAPSFIIEKKDAFVNDLR